LTFTVIYGIIIIGGEMDITKYDLDPKRKPNENIWKYKRRRKRLNKIIKEYLKRGVVSNES
jgi:hypothetical protein